MPGHYIDPKYTRSTAEGNPQYKAIPIRRAPPGYTAQRHTVGDPVKGERLAAVKRWRPKGRRR